MLEKRWKKWKIALNEDENVFFSFIEFSKIS